MAIRSGFFNSLEIQNEDGTITYDREYYASEFADYLTKVVGNGVFATPSSNLQILASSNMDVIVKAGEGRIDGYWINNNSDYTITLDDADVILNRIDRIVMQLNYESRAIDIVYKVGTLATDPVAPELIRNEQIKEYSLARIYVGKNVTSITQSVITDTRPLENECGLIATMGAMESNNYFIQMQDYMDNFMSTKSNEFNSWEEAQEAAFNAWFETIKDTVRATTLYREYQALYKTAVEEEQTITIPESINYIHNGLDVLNIFINGKRLLKNVEYTINSDGTAIVLTTPLYVAGTDVEFVNKKSIDGTAAESVVIQVEQLQEDVNNLSNCTYKATGADDNIKLSDIVKNFLNGTGDYSSAADNASMKIDVVGTLTIDTLIEEQMVFDFHKTNASNRRIIVDFGNATIPVLPSPDTQQNILAIFGADNSNTIIENANIYVGDYNAKTIYGFHGGIVRNCKIEIENSTASVLYGVWGANEVSNSVINIYSEADEVIVTGVYSTEKVITNNISISPIFIETSDLTIFNYGIYASDDQLVLGNILNQDIYKTEDTGDYGNMVLKG